ncbi:MAG: alpha/beta hydrolase [Thermoplasmata archaeon]|nr:alpha/beta hydrolase-fold protein [Thermoplasmata archaeon]
MTSFRVPIESRSEAVFPGPIKGRVETHRYTSRVLEGNPWGDPVERDLPVYVPPSGETEGRPLLILLSGYAGSGWLHFQRPRFHTDSIVGRLDRLVRTGVAAEAVLAAPDCVTTLGGSQYLNSTATGRYEDYVVRELVPFLKERYRTGPCAVVGTSSGGYGALSLALRYPDLFPAAGSNAGDSFFEYCYPPDFPVAFRETRAAGGPEALLRRVLSRPISGFGPAAPLAKTLSLYAYASCYSPRDAEPGRFDLPFDLETGGLREDVWKRWLALDPVRMVTTEPYRSSVRRLRYLYVDGGWRDEYGLDIGAREFAARAKESGARVDLEEYDGVHADGGPRYDVLLPRVLTALGFPGASPAPTTL